MCPRYTTPRPRHYHEARKIFEKLSVDPCYRNCFNGEKLNIIAHIINIREDLYQFANEVNHEPHELNGRLMEYCAHFSDQLPRNSPKAEEYANIIIAYLHQKRRCNPDYLWLNLHGKRVILTGFGEVKSHIANINKYQRQQTTRQEHNIIQCMKSKEIIASLIPDKRVIIPPNGSMKRYLIVPRSTGEPYKHPYALHYTWEIKEIEFTFQEILFLKNCLL